MHIGNRRNGCGWYVPPASANAIKIRLGALALSLNEFCEAGTGVKIRPEKFNSLFQIKSRKLLEMPEKQGYTEIGHDNCFACLWNCNYLSSP
ncbi:MAG: hypothetical protein NC319_01815, partial [Butyricicoccus sp.]|nr:hypothetical protein [Butyricicoccus sp.]